MSEDKLAALKKRLDSYATSSQGFLNDVTKAQANVEQFKAFQERATGLTGCFDDDELAQVASADLFALEGEVERFIEDAFFREPDENESVELPPLPQDTTYRDHPVVWRLGSLDLTHPKNWLVDETPAALAEVLAKLRSLESFTWRKLITDHSEHTHEWEDGELADWAPASLRRLEALNLDDQSDWFQIHLDGRGRLFGFRDEYIFNIVWWDRDHEVYETRRLRRSQRR